MIANMQVFLYTREPSLHSVLVERLQSDKMTFGATFC